jgi:hypothetical protein
MQGRPKDNKTNEVPERFELVDLSLLMLLKLGYCFPTSSPHRGMWLHSMCVRVGSAGRAQ